MKRSVHKNMANNALYTLLNALFPMLASMYAARVLFKDDVGRIAYAQNIVSYFVSFAALGIPQYGIREISRRVKANDHPEQTFSELFWINGISTAVFCAAYLLLLFRVDRFYQALPLYIIAGLPLLANVFNVDWYYSGCEEYGYIAKRNMLVKSGCLLAIVGLVHRPEQYLLYALLFSLATAGNYLLNLFHLYGRVRLCLHGLHFRRHFAPIAIMLCSVLANDLYTKVDTTMIGIWGQNADVAIYTYAINIARAFCALTAAISTATLPRMSVYHQEGRRQAFSDLLSSTYEIVLLLVAPCLLALWIVPDSIVMVLYGEDYLACAGLLRILALIVLIISTCCICGQVVLISANREKYQLLAMAVGSGINILLNSCLIPRYGVYGAAAASVISEAVVLLVYLRHSAPLFRLRFDRGYIPSLLLACLGLALTLFAVTALLGATRLGFCVCFLLGGLVYFTILAAGKNRAFCDICRSVVRTDR